MRSSATKSMPASLPHRPVHSSHNQARRSSCFVDRVVSQEPLADALELLALGAVVGVKLATNRRIPPHLRMLEETGDVPERSLGGGGGLKSLGRDHPGDRPCWNEFWKIMGPRMGCSSVYKR
jgi:hypothetical protein